ncbi:interleukin-1 beta-like [Aquarana catesbeiana]|uniref:interleukin-1 beta-like n=1 Tax=Aquarana catesbeiana TaxID=8400 RepID=UPI003CCA5842
MSSVQLQLEYLMAYWNMPRVITYPTPPYITLRMNIGFHQGPPLPRPRLFLDTIRKLSSAEDRRYYRRDRGEEESLLTKGEVYKIGTSQTSQIHDDGSKWIFYNPSSGLMALPKQNPEGARFVITKYSTESDTDKVPVTLKINGTNLYLSCSNGELILENNDENLDTIQGPTKRFLFLRTRSLNHVTFESVMSQKMYICTNSSGPSPVNMSKDSDPKKIVGFTIDAEVVGIFVMVGNNRFSLRIPKETLKRLQEYNQLMAEILMKGLLTDRYGILFVDRLDI